MCSAAEHIRRGDANLMLAGGADAAIIPSGMGGFIACKALSKRNDAPERASRPWDQGRDGFVMGEGAGKVAGPLLCLRGVATSANITTPRQQCTLCWRAGPEAVPHDPVKSGLAERACQQQAALLHSMPLQQGSAGGL